MDFTKNHKYFKQNSKLFLLGIPLIVIGAVLSILLGFKNMVIGIVIAVAGVVFMIACLTGGMKDDDIDGAVASKMNTIEADASELFKFPRRYEVLHKAVILGGFDFTRESSVPVKRGSDLKYRTEYYCGLLMNFTNDGLRILSKKFSILKDEMDQENLFFPWEDVLSSQLDEQEVTFKMVDGSDCTLKVDIYKINLKDGKTLEYCVRNTADVDEAIDMIYRQSVRVKQAELKAKAEENA
ncbi:MAG: hypothetical protein IKZ09_05150 [Clostridia bacterium]|nr:hypothetical protein [Clostridia bacterium]